MMMNDPVHPGKLIEAHLEELELSVAEAAAAMKVTRQQLCNVLRGKRAVSSDIALRLENAFGGGATDVTGNAVSL